MERGYQEVESEGARQKLRGLVAVTSGRCVEDYCCTRQCGSGPMVAASKKARCGSFAAHVVHAKAFCNLEGHLKKHLGMYSPVLPIVGKLRWHKHKHTEELAWAIRWTNPIMVELAKEARRKSLLDGARAFASEGKHQLHGSLIESLLLLLVKSLKRHMQEQEAGKMKIERERKKAGLVWAAAAKINCNII
ncbi:hypothetical protein NC652_020448 [Populus alba x Populus x berolinensis]|nr:hypothetical protein NC652_020448 [Populus alba x Populus x berolinensis]